MDLLRTKQRLNHSCVVPIFFLLLLELRYLTSCTDYAVTSWFHYVLPFMVHYVSFIDTKGKLLGQWCCAFTDRVKQGLSYWKVIVCKNNTLLNGKIIFILQDHYTCIEQSKKAEDEKCKYSLYIQIFMLLCKYRFIQSIFIVFRESLKGF